MVRIIGTSDDVTTCDHCGRTDLRRTVHLDLGEGEDAYYGTTCAAHAFGHLGTAVTITDTAMRMCSCGCGQFANRITAAGRRFHVGCMKVSA